MNTLRHFTDTRTSDNIMPCIRHDVATSSLRAEVCDSSRLRVRHGAWPRYGS